MVVRRTPDRQAPDPRPAKSAGTADDADSFVSFGFLQDHEERPAASSAFTSLFDRLRAAFGAPHEEEERSLKQSISAPISTQSPTPQHTSGTPARQRPVRLPSGGTLSSTHGIMPLRTVSPAITSVDTGPVAMADDGTRSPTATDFDPDETRRSESMWSFGGAIQSVPGFPLGGDVLDDTRSVATTTRDRPDGEDDTASMVGMRFTADAWIRRFRGEGLSRKYWMADETAKECHECYLPFSALRRKHHCRICGQIFCHRCAAYVVPGERWGHKGGVRSCYQCMHMLEEYDRRRQDISLDLPQERGHSRDSPRASSVKPTPQKDLHTPLSQFAATALFSQDKEALAARSESSESCDSTIAAVPLDSNEPIFVHATDLDDETVDKDVPFRSGLVEEAPADILTPPPDLGAAKEERADDDGDAEPPAHPAEEGTPAPDVVQERSLSPIKRSTARQKLMRGGSRFVTSTALAAPSLVYFLRMLHQLLLSEHVDKEKEWKETVKMLALAVVERVHVRTRNTYLTDIRHFVKIKCFPGGRVSDCEFVDGFVCTKNVATRGMAAMLPVRNARLMVITFPIEYHRNANQLMALESIMAQEQEFLRILVARIVAKRPHVVVCEKGVSHMALEMLETAGIVVLSGMKRTSIDTIAHCTMADVITSIDRLALEPRLGRAAVVTVDNYEQLDDPERRKPLLRIEVTSKEVSSAMVLRGAPLPVLRRIKAILTLMVFVGYNLKLEESLRRDIGAKLDWSVMNFNTTTEPPVPALHGDDEQRRLILDETLKKYQRLLLSASISVVIPPPYLVTRMKALGDRLQVLRALVPTRVHDVHVEPGEYDDLGGRSLSLCAPSSWAPLAERAMLELERDMIQPCWNACVSRMSRKLTPFAHQNLVLLVTKTCAATQHVCAGPEYETHEYYGPDDEPLGQALERICAEGMQPCGAKGCESPNLEHYTTWVHSSMQVQMVVEHFACPLPGEESHLLCWSYCKKCELTTPVVRLSDEGWSHSFAKYLELQLYPNASCQLTLCEHDYQRDCVRYFALQNLAIRFHADAIAPWEVALPPFRFLMNEVSLCETINAELCSLFDKNVRYWRSVRSRIAALRQELASGALYATGPLAKMRTHADALLARIYEVAETDCEEMERRMADTYWQSERSILCLNDVRRFLQDRVVEWDLLFLEFEKRSTISERDLRKLTELYRKRALTDSDGSDGEVLGLPHDRKLLELSPLLELWAGSDREKHDPQRVQDSKRISVLIDGVASWRDAGLDTPKTGPKAETPEQAVPVAPTSVGSENDPAITPLLDAVLARETPSPRPPSSYPASDTPDAAGDPAPQDSETLSVGRSNAMSDSSDAAPATSQAPMTTAGALAAPPPPAELDVNESHADRLVPAPTAKRSASRSPPRQYSRSFLRPEVSRVLNESRTSEETASTPKAASNDAPDPAAKPALRPTPLWRPESRSRSSWVRPHGVPRSQVSMMARHFDQLHRDAEQQRLSARVRRARPVTTTHATVEVFKSLRDAVRGDESDTEDDTKQLESSHGARRGAAWLGEDARFPLSRHSYMEPPPSAAPSHDSQRKAGALPIRITKSPNSHSDTFSAVPASQSTDETPDATSEGTSVSARPDAVAASSAASEATDAAMNEAAASNASPADITAEPALNAAPPSDDAAADQAPNGKAPEDTNAPSEAAASTEPEETDKQETPLSERTRLFHVLESTWNLHVGDMKPLDYPFLSTDHVFSDARVVVREDEPSSIIAFTLDSRSYEEQMAERQQARRAESADETAYLDRELRRVEGLHSLYEFDTGSVKLWCKIFFAEQFDALRRTTGCDAHFVSSLSRCVKWNSQGGKSGSAFLKTRDDRLVVKQLSRAELDGFSKFAPQYFAYLADCRAQGRPTALTKIYGYFRIGFKNTLTGKGFKMDFLVMENLLYGREIAKVRCLLTQIFDLKGSTRHRLVQESGRAHDVLLDENLLHCMSCPNARRADVAPVCA